MYDNETVEGGFFYNLESSAMTWCSVWLFSVAETRDQKYAWRGAFSI